MAEETIDDVWTVQVVFPRTIVNTASNLLRNAHHRRKTHTHTHNNKEDTENMERLTLGVKDNEQN